MHLTNPSLWAVNMFFLGFCLELGGYQVQWLALASLVAAVVLFLYATFKTAALPGSLWNNRHAVWSLRFGGKLPLHVPAQIAYEAARKNKTLWAHPSEKLGTAQSPGGVLDYVATYFGMHVPMTGKRPPSTLDDLIDTKPAGKGTFEGGAQRLEMNDGHTVFIDLHVNATDVHKVVKVLSEKVFPDGEG